MSPATKKTVQTVLLILVTLAVYGWRDGWFTGGTTAEAPTGSAPSARPDGSRTGYAPASAEPRDAIPGDGLSAHEGLDGGHTLDRHVGRSFAQLKQRLDREDKREVSTFRDEASADRFVAQALYDRRVDVARWLASTPSGNEAFPSRLREPAGDVLRRGARDVVPGRSVTVVLAPSRRFPEGFRIVTAYVTLP